jgi:aldose 1-epimerase
MAAEPGPTNVRRPAASGAQFRISRGDQEVTVTEVGAAVREYRTADRDVFQSYPEPDVSYAFHGVVLVPWPNRIRDGRYVFDGESHQLPLSEPERGNAIHGLGAWQLWSVVDHSAETVTMRLRLLPSPGYPFFLETTVCYSLDDDGLAVTATSTNEGDNACPYAIGFHPYLSTGRDATLDDCALRLDAASRLLADERLIPIGREAVAGTDYDFRVARSLAEQSFNDGFADLANDSAGRSWAQLASSDGHAVELWADSSCGFFQVYSGDRLPPHLARRSLAVEPMTAAPNAYQSGEGLRRLEPGQSCTTRWGAGLRPA